MSMVFWVAFTLVVYTYFVYPICIAIFAWRSPRSWRRAPYSATVSIVMAVRNGGKMLTAQLDRLVTLSPHLVREVIVVSDGSDDNTAEQILACNDPRVLPIIFEQNQGKAAALNAAIARATGEIVLFVDVRPHLHETALDELLCDFSDPSVGCVTGQLQLVTDRHDGAASAVSGLYWRYEQWIRGAEAKWDSPLGVYGGCYAVRRSLLTSFPPGLILDDMFQPLHVVEQGYRTVVDCAARVTDSWPTEIANEFRRKVRTLAGNFQLMAQDPWLLTSKNRLWFQFFSHKVMRLVAPYLLCLLLISPSLLAIHSVIWMKFAIIEWECVGLAFAALRIHLPVAHRGISALGAFLVLNVAAVAGLYRFIFSARGALHTALWSVTSSTRPAHRRSRAR